MQAGACQVLVIVVGLRQPQWIVQAGVLDVASVRSLADSSHPESWGKASHSCTQRDSSQGFCTDYFFNIAGGFTSVMQFLILHPSQQNPEKHDMNLAPPTPHRAIRLNQVCAITGLSRSSIYEKGSARSKYYDASFPASFKLGMRSVAWNEHEVEQWLKSRKEACTSGH